MMNAEKGCPFTLQIASFTQDVATLYTQLDGILGQKVCNSLICSAGHLYGTTPGGLICYDSEADSWHSVAAPVPADAPIVKLFPDRDGGLLVNTTGGVYRFDPSENLTTHLAPGFTFIQAARADQAGQLWLFAPLDLSGEILAALPAGATVRALTVLHDGTAVIGTDRGLFRYHDGRLEPISLHSAAANVPDSVPDADIHALACDPHGGLWVASADSLYLYTASAWLDLSTVAIPPVTPVRCMALAPDGSLWIGTPRGAARLRDGSWRYFAGNRWLPHDHVNAIAIGPDGDAWIGTNAGIARIGAARLTWAEKAAHYEAITAARHNRDGYVTDCFLTRPGDHSSALPHASDNDGLWTSLYLCAESFRFAVTGEPQARELARRSMQALLDLVRLTGIPGFPARAVIQRGERVHQSDPGPNWYPSPVDPDVLYKDDTSSDEIDGHYLAWYVYAELVADADEKSRIAEVCRAVTDHILDHDYTLVGPTGMPTRWGVWRPEALNDDPAWASDRGLNSLEILSHLKVALHLCPCDRYEQAYRTLIREHHFALNTLTQKVLPPDGYNNHSDDELAACAYYPLLQLETDPYLSSLYRLSLERTQSILRPERSPFYNVIYGACTGRPCEAEAAARWLQDAPLDLRDWAMTNSHRRDVLLDPEPDRFNKAQLVSPLPPGELGVHRWNYNPYQADSEGNGGSEMDGAFWLLPYWMGRFHRIFREKGKGEREK